MDFKTSAERYFIIAFAVLMVYGCASFKPHSIDEVPFRERTQTQSEGDVRVTAAVPSAEESEKLFGVPVYKRGVQPVWLEIENKGKGHIWFAPVSLDPAYFSPFEAAFVNHFPFMTAKNDTLNRLFYERSQNIYIGPGSVESGFIFTPVDEGTKAFNVDVAGEDWEVKTFVFYINVPGLRVDHEAVDWDNLYSEDKIVSYDEEGFRKAIENLPSSTTNKKGTEQGDPLNIVVVGDHDDVLHAFVRAGWDETETIYFDSALKTGISFIFGGRYRYSPVSGLYVFGRPQDVAFQKARGSIHERNHLRLWLAPMRFEGKHVWAGQISRDIGVRFTSKTITTHKIDPDVDETRDFLIQDLMYSQSLAKVAFEKGVGEAPIEEPRGNLTGDPYFTDGLRAVMWVASEPIPFDEVELISWEIPERR